MKNKTKTNFWNFKSFRLFLAILFFIVTMAPAFGRDELSMAMVCMVNSTTSSTNVSFNSSSQCSSNSQNKEYTGAYLWGHYQQSLLFSLYFFGGLVVALPAGWFADKYNPKLIITIAVCVQTTGNVLIPVITQHVGYVGLAVLRFIMGMFGWALVNPNISAISARWIPPVERSTVTGFYLAGNEMANIVGMPLNAALCLSTFLNGWPAIFYINAFIGLFSLTLWTLFASSRPEYSKFTSENEKQYITLQLSNQNLGNEKPSFIQIPWKKLLSSPAIWSCMFGDFCVGCMSNTLSAYIPTYFKNVLDLNLLSNGLLSSLPFICKACGKIGFGIIGDKMKSRLSHTATCKLFNTISCCGVAVFLIACSYMNCTTSGFAVAFLCLANLSLSINVAGYNTSIICVVPKYSGIVMSMTRFCGLLASVIAPLIVAWLTPNQTAEEWKNVFFLISGLMILFGLMFLLFGSGSILEWAQSFEENGKKKFNTDDSFINPQLISEKF